jgi:hypothetical protein
MTAVERLLDRLSGPPRCKYGHALTGVRSVTGTRRTRRYCLECNRDSYRRWYDAHKRKGKLH